MVGLPDVSGRELILEVHTQNKPLSLDVDLKKLAKRTSGMSGADLEKIVNEAAIAAAKNGEEFISMDYLNEALDKEKSGKARKSAVLSDEAKERVAYHEGGHTIMSLHEGLKANELDKVTIIPRSRALGVTVFNIKEDMRILPKYSEYITQLRVAAAGRVAEEVIYGSYTETAGAGGDIQMMSGIARRMVLELGMSRKLGMVKYSSETGNGYATASSETAKVIDDEVKRLIDDAYSFVREVLEDPKNIDQLHKLTAALLEKETLEAAEVIDLLDINEHEDPHEKAFLADNGLEGVGPAWEQYATNLKTLTVL
jgi:cell division protease FtsH